MLKNIAVLLYFLSALLIAFGFVTMYYYGDYNPDNLFDSGSKFGHIVGGDAYNYIIIGIRGLGFIVTGLITTVVASALLIIDQIKESFKTNTSQNQSEIENSSLSKLSGFKIDSTNDQ